MNAELFDRERQYLTSFSIAQMMHRRGLLTSDELTVIDTKFREKFKPLLGGLYPLETAENLDFTGV